MHMCMPGWLLQHSLAKNNVIPGCSTTLVSTSTSTSATMSGLPPLASCPSTLTLWSTSCPTWFPQPLGRCCWAPTWPPPGCGSPWPSCPLLWLTVDTTSPSSPLPRPTTTTTSSKACIYAAACVCVSVRTCEARGAVSLCWSSVCVCVWICMGENARNFVYECVYKICMCACTFALDKQIWCSYSTFEVFRSFSSTMQAEVFVCCYLSTQYDGLLCISLQVQPELWCAWCAGQTSRHRQSVPCFQGLRTPLPAVGFHPNASAVPRPAQQEQVRVSCWSAVTDFITPNSWPVCLVSESWLLCASV